MLEIPLEAPRLEHTPRLVLGDVIADHCGLEYEAGFLLFIEDGVLDFLEAFTFAQEDWPGADENFVLRYWSSGDERDMERLRSELRPAE